MIGRTSLSGLPSILAVALVAAAVSVSSSASARPQGEPAAPPTPATPAPSTDEKKADDKKPEENKTDDTKKDEKKPEDAAQTQAPGATPAAQAEPGATPAGTSAPGDAQGGITIGLGTDAPRKDEAKVESKKTDDEEEVRNPFEGSTFFWDHSATTNTVGLSSQQSRIPLYEWWFGFRPIYTFKHTGKRLSFRVRADLYKELTNNQDTTYKNESVFGDTWLTLRWADKITERLKHTKYAVAGTVKLPTSKESQGQGVYVKTGASVGLIQDVPLAGESAKWFPGMKVSLTGSYDHAFSRSTTSTNGEFTALRQDVEGHSLVTNQVNGAMLANHSVYGILGADLNITEKWTFGVTGILINRWNYAPTGDVSVATATGNVYIPRSGNSTNFVQSTWIVLGSDYEILDELSAGIGYYNIASIKAPDGQNRGIVSDHNIWWSPDARVSAVITANLGAIYERAAGIPKEDKDKKKTAKGPLSPTSTH